MPSGVGIKSYEYTWDKYILVALVAKKAGSGGRENFYKFFVIAPVTIIFF